MIAALLATLLAADPAAEPAPQFVLERLVEALRAAGPQEGPIAPVVTAEAPVRATLRGLRVEVQVAIGTGTARPARLAPPAEPARTEAPIASPPAAAAARVAAPPPIPAMATGAHRRLAPDGRLTVTFVDAAGRPRGAPVVRHVATLPIVTQRRDDEGRIVRIVLDDAGAPVEVLLDPMGRFVRAELRERFGDAP